MMQVRCRPCGKKGRGPKDRRTVNAARSCSNHALVDGGGVTTKGDLR